MISGMCTRLVAGFSEKQMFMLVQDYILQPIFEDYRIPANVLIIYPW